MPYRSRGGRCHEDQRRERRKDRTQREGADAGGWGTRTGARSMVRRHWMRGMWHEGSPGASRCGSRRGGGGSARHRHVGHGRRAHRHPHWHTDARDDPGSIGERPDDRDDGTPHPGASRPPLPLPPASSTPHSDNIPTNHPPALRGMPLNSGQYTPDIHGIFHRNRS